MERITLRGTSIQTSRLGMGCASLTRHADQDDAIALLEATLSSGVTHFDVAPQYGFGQAEGILGRFVKGKRDQITIATKFGLTPSAALAKHKGFVSFARNVARRSRVFASLARRVLKRTGQRSYDPADAARSLEKSLVELGTDYVDLFLLHDCSPADAAREELRRFLEDEQRRGRIRAYGVATSFEKLGTDAAVYPPEYRVLQFDHCAMNGQIGRLAQAENRALITFGATAGAVALAEAKGMDVDAAAALLLRAALDDHPQGMVLFATTRIEHLQANVRTAERPPLTVAERNVLDLRPPA